MPTSTKFKLLFPALLLVAVLALPAAAGATLAYVKNPLHAAVFVAEDNGSNPHKVGSGHDPRVSPNGQLVAYLHEGANSAQELKVASTAGGGGKTVMANLQEAFYLAWSPDSTKIAALRGSFVGKRKLVVIDVASGTQRILAQGFFSGFSFSPDGSELVYSHAGSEKYPPRSDVFRVSIAGGKPVALTHDHRSLDPLWGPTGQIVFVKQLGASKRKYGPKNELYLMNPQGKGVKRLTHTKVDPLLIGLFPTDWSADGQRLLAEFEGQDTSYAVTVNPKTGAQRAVAGKAEQGFVGTALSSDGSLVLGFNGGFDPGLRNHKVQTVPYSGGKPKTLVKEAFEPDWSL
jgi:dipeptidyl aminopeptidase/acylaminoacyl peptidase